MKKKLYTLFALSVGFLGLNSCNESDLDPTLGQDKELDESLITPNDLSIFMNGLYNRMRNTNYYGRDYYIYGEVRSDNAFSNGNSNRYVIESEMRYTPDQGNMPDTWSRIYEVIGWANLAINKYEGVGGWLPLEGNEAEIKHYVGIAYTLRAMGHFDLVRIFGQHYVTGQGGMNSLGVPYVKVFRGDPANPYPARNTVQEVYDNAMDDINTAISLMDSSLDPVENYYGSSYLPRALKSRMATYFGDYTVARAVSKEIIDSAKYSIIAENDFVNSWKGQTSRNWIFSIYANTSNESLGINGLAYIYRLPASGSGYGDVVGLGNLHDIFGSGDVRVSSVMSSAKTGDGGGQFRNIGKFPDTATGGDAIPLFRYEEIVLNYAESLLASDPAEALVWLNRIPQNRGAGTYTVANMDNILLERRKEFAFEGFRFHDLVRTGQGIPLLDDIRQRFTESISAGASKLAFPIPNTEIGANSNMVQNNGY
ncbi:MAG: RagB/SusD family nutrient uptake outer membrane protein [Capnocytophaga sp.]|nr:RagB/SusD family nutrient uptake outer membrane protein [Capnocytophaga sp.]